MPIDAFERNSLVIMTLGVAIMLAFSYIGTSMGFELGGTDAMVEEMAADSAGKEGQVVVDLEGLLGEYGEPIGFTIAGIAGGFVAGFAWPQVFGRREESA